MVGATSYELLTGFGIPLATLVVLAAGVYNWPSVKEGRKRKAQAEDVLLGVEAGPGIESRPSLVARMATVEQGHQQLVSTVNEIKQQVVPNGGDTKTLGDTVQRLEKTLTAHTVAEEGILDKLHAKLAAHTEADAGQFEALRDGQRDLSHQLTAATTAVVDQVDGLNGRVASLEEGEGE